MVRHAVTIRRFDASSHIATEGSPVDTWGGIELGETLAARARHGDIAERAADGVTRIVTADALSFAHNRGKLDGMAVPAGRLWEIGHLYRRCFESVGAMLTPTRHEVRGSSAGGGGVQDAVIASGQTLAILRLHQTADHVEVLDKVCGHDVTINRLAERVGVNPRTLENRLRVALVTASDNWAGAQAKWNRGRLPQAA